jgi:hypothetical protein
MSFHLKKIAFFVSSLFFIHTAFATNVTLLPAKQLIKNLPSVIFNLKETTKETILFPKKVPNHPKKLFASAELSKKSSEILYRINIDSTENCHGVHYCNIGSMTATTKAPDKSMKNKIITTTVKLANGLTGQFTPGHAMADYWPPQLTWRDKNRWYTLTWNVTVQGMSEKDLLVAMANSAISH